MWGLFRKRPQPKVDQGELEAITEGWILWAWESPPEGVLVQVWRRGWVYSQLMTEVNPEMNVNGLYWRLTGIAKEQLGV